MTLEGRIHHLYNENRWPNEFARRIGADAGQASRYENGKITPSADVVVKLAQALDVSCDYLLIEGAPRRPFRSADHRLGERFAALEELPPEDLASLLNHLKAIAGDVS